MKPSTKKPTPKKPPKLEGGKTKDGLSIQQEYFCQLFTSGNKHYFNNATASYIEAYEIDIRERDEKGNSTGQRNNSVYNGVRSSASALLTTPNVKARVNKLLEEGFSDESVDKELQFIIKQSDDLGPKLSAIKEYNRLKARVIEKPPVGLTLDLTGKTMKEIEEIRKSLL